MSDKVRPLMTLVRQIYADSFVENFKKLTFLVGFFVYNLITIMLSTVFINIVILKQKQRHEKQPSNF